MKTLEKMMKLWDDRHRHMAERLDASGKFDTSDEAQRHGERLADALAVMSLVADELDELNDKVRSLEAWQNQQDNYDYEQREHGN